MCLKVRLQLRQLRLRPRVCGTCALIQVPLAVRRQSAELRITIPSPP
jgi:hypothetical protein